MKKHIRMASIMAAACMITSSIHAQGAMQDRIRESVVLQNDAGEGADQAPAFEELDKNHRGQLKRSDFPKDIPALAQIRAHFAEADLNHDGQISPDEYHQYVDRNTRHH